MTDEQFKAIMESIASHKRISDITYWMNLVYTCTIAAIVSLWGYGGK